MIYFNKLINICINRYESQKVVNNYFVGTNNVSVQTQRTDKYKNQSEMVDFFFCKFLFIVARNKGILNFMFIHGIIVA